MFADDLPGFGLRLRASGERVLRSWVCQYRRGGATRRLLLGSADVVGVEQARAAAKKALAKIALGEDPQADKVARRAKDEHSLRAMIGEYLAHKKCRVRPRTFRETRRYLTAAISRPCIPCRSMRSPAATSPPGWSRSPRAWLITAARAAPR